MELVRYARVCSDVSDFNERNFCLTEKLLQQGYRYHKLIKTFTIFFFIDKRILFRNLAVHDDLLTKMEFPTLNFTAKLSIRHTN